MNSFMNTRVSKILSELINGNEPVSGKYLAKLTGVTDRTIRNDIKFINLHKSELGVAIDSVHRKGYVIKIQNNEKYRELLHYLKCRRDYEECHIPITPKDRVEYTIKKLLISTGYLTIEQIAKELFVSKSTIVNDLIKVEEKLNEYDLKILRKRNYGIKLWGNEINIRTCIAKHLVNRSYEETLDLYLKDILELVKLKQIKEILLKELQSVNIEFTDSSLHSLSIHIVIIIKRLQIGCHIKRENIKEIDTIACTKQYTIAKNIAKVIEELLNIKIPHEEIIYIAMHLLSKKEIVNYNKTFKDLNKIVEASIINLIDKIINKIKKTYFLDLSGDKEFIWGLAIHLKYTLNRLRFNMNSENPILDHIKLNYNYAFEMAITSAQIITDYTKIYFNEHEVGYIALHFAAALERLRIKYKKKFRKILIVCTTGMGTAKLIEAKAKKIFGNAKIVLTLPQYKIKKVDINSFDLILTTVPLSIKTSIPVVKIDDFLRDEDIEFLNIFSNKEIDKPNSIDINDIKLNDLFSKNLFVKGCSYKDKFEIINQLSDMLIEQGYVDERFKEFLIKREKISPTDYGNLVAIPHAINNRSLNFKVVVSILKKPIDWGKNKVQLILMLVLPKQLDQDYKQVFEELLCIINNKDLIIKLINSQNYEDFVDTISIVTKGDENKYGHNK
ncbi:BglG family transcription antiterminator [Caldisalinibacter kiritimatiensis]|uniref:Transcriptional antiterminator of lichenan operon, BglG family n=1 Tax=Caldisalinibacter kiritimatiensis TaxID=1304284 RepID=R1ATI7_9FIRM|nr:BglG family transcription antiterminator [Caldisalinibacter kiritimatiensis]EOC99941.1 Transcriptional antiterminator of lichenan operon, BglG family [Caldisalinibacter kiritimatiensis]